MAPSKFITIIIITIVHNMMSKFGHILTFLILIFLHVVLSEAFEGKEGYNYIFCTALSGSFALLISRL